MNRLTEDDPSATWLARHAGWVLVSVGVAQVALAAVFRDSVAVAPVFAILGTGCVVLGVIVDRVESFELGTKGIRAVVARLAKEPALGAVSARDVMEFLNAALSRHGNRLRLPGPEGVVDEVITDIGDARQAEERVAEWLRERDWTVERTTPGGFPYDFIARRGDETLYVEVKFARRPARPEQLGQVLIMASFLPSVVARNTRYALFVVGAGLTSAALANLKSQKLIEVYVSSPEGFEQIV